MIDCGRRFFSASSAQCIFLRFSIHIQILLDWYLFPWNPPNQENPTTHYSDVKMGAIASQITGVSIVNSIVCSVVDQRKCQSSASLVVVKVIHWWPVNSTKARKCFHWMTSSWNECSWNMASGWLAAQYYFGVFWHILWKAMRFSMFVEHDYVRSCSICYHITKLLSFGNPKGLIYSPLMLLRLGNLSLVDVNGPTNVGQAGKSSYTMYRCGLLYQGGSSKFS